LFFELIWRKLNRLILLNLIFFVISFPMLTAIYFIFYAFIFAGLQQPSTGAAQAGADLSSVTAPLLPALLFVRSAGDTRYSPLHVAVRVNCPIRARQLRNGVFPA